MCLKIQPEKQFRNPLKKVYESVHALGPRLIQMQRANTMPENLFSSN